MHENSTHASTQDDLRLALVTMAVESWRVSKVIIRLINSLDAGEKNRYASQVRWFLKKTEESLKIAGLKMVNVEGSSYDPGIAATPLNIEEFDVNDRLVVDQMLEPIIMAEDHVERAGTVLLRKVECR